MPSNDQPKTTPPPRDRLGGQAPMIKDSAGRWTTELTGDDDGIEVVYDRSGGIIRIIGVALVRHPAGDVREPVTIVIRQEDATSLGGRIMGPLGRIM